MLKKRPHIVHLNLIYMSYDQKKGQESNFQFDSRSQTPWKQGSNEFWLGQAIHHWKDFFKGYKILPSHFFLKKTWFEKNMNVQSFRITRIPVLGLPLGNSDEKWHLHVAPMQRHEVYYREGSGASSQRLWPM
jgi:hypothetical protein